MQKKFLIFLSIFIFGFFISNGKITVAENVKPTPTITNSYVPGEIIVGFNEEKINLKAGLGEIAAKNFAEKNHLLKLKNLDKLNARVYKIKNNQNLTAEIAKLKENPLVRYVEPNYIWHLADLPNDPYLNNQYAIYNFGQTINGQAGTADADMDVDEAWEIHKGDGSVIVAVVDSGVALNHPDLKNQIVAGYDFVDNDTLPFDGNGHGTHVAGIIGAIGNNGLGISGINQNVKIMPLRVLDTQGTGTTSNIAAAIIWATEHGAQIINTSIQGTNYSQAMYEAIKFANDRGALLVAAAGNQGRNNEITHNYPSDYDLEGIISVASTDNNDQLSSFSNYGSVSVDVGAPGSNIFSTYIYQQFKEDFESAPSSFTQSGTYGDAWGIISTGNNKAAYVDINWYPGWSRPNATEYLTSPKINLNGQSQITLEFEREGYIAEPTNGECTDWLGVQAYNGSTWKLVWATCGANNEEGKNSGHISLDLSNFANENFQFRFVWQTSNLANSIPENMLLDNIELYVGSSSNENYKFLSGTSMATPNVAGVASLLKSYKPSATIKEIKEAILNTGDPKESLQGKTVSGKRVNAAKAIKSLKTLSTTPNLLAPTNFIAAEGNKQIKLKWKNPNVWDFTGVKIVRQTKDYPKNPNDGKLIYDGNGTVVVDKNLKNGKRYYYSAFAYDKNGNYSSHAAHLAAIPGKRTLFTIKNFSSIAAFDLNRKGGQEIILGGLEKGIPKIAIFTSSAKKLSEFYPFGKSYHCSVNVAAGDVDGDGKEEIIAGTGKGCPPLVKIFNPSGKPKKGKSTIRPYPGKNGVNIAVGDLDGDGKEEIITGPGKGQKSKIKIFGYVNKKIKPVLNKAGFYAFSKSEKSGILVFAGDLDFDGKDEIIATPQKAKKFYLKIFNDQGKSPYNKSKFYLFEKAYKGGAKITIGDSNADGYEEIIAAKNNTPYRLEFFQLSLKNQKTSFRKIKQKNIAKDSLFVIIRK